MAEAALPLAGDHLQGYERGVPGPEDRSKHQPLQAQCLGPGQCFQEERGRLNDGRSGSASVGKGPVRLWVGALRWESFLAHVNAVPGVLKREAEGGFTNKRRGSVVKGPEAPRDAATSRWPPPGGRTGKKALVGVWPCPPCDLGPGSLVLASRATRR